MIIAFDTETTGVDLHHGAKPYLVTTCRDDSEFQTYWEWWIDPKTRQPQIPPEDLEEIVSLLESADEIVGQNIKFDAHALKTVIPKFDWPWKKTHDTLVAAHILASNADKDLTSLGVEYLDEDIQEYEDRVEVAVNECHKIARKYYKDWRIAKRGLPEMPSAKEKVWKFDMWLPRIIARQNKYPENHSYWTVTRDYANKDTETTLGIWLRPKWGIRDKLIQRGLCGNIRRTYESPKHSL